MSSSSISPQHMININVTLGVVSLHSKAHAYNVKSVVLPSQHSYIKLLRLLLAVPWPPQCLHAIR